MTARHVTCCIAGGGPAGMVLGLLLARAGVEVAVLEKHADFLRDFRGDTIHPSTLELMAELGVLEAFLTLPHQKAGQLNAFVNGEAFTVADFSHLPTTCRYIAFMPQWDFLAFIAEQGRTYPTFHLHMQAEATDLIEEAGRVAGLRAQTPDGPLEVRADLTVAADGRHSKLRARAGLTVEELGAPMDVLWFALSRPSDDPPQFMGRFEAGRIFIMLNRNEYWQCGYVIPKGTFADIRHRGIEAFRRGIVDSAPFLGERPGELRSWDDVSLLTVRVDRLNRWHRDGLLCIGDAAHAMSPVGGVGINLAIQDAVAAANILAAPLRERRLAQGDLRRVQRRRELPARLTQRMQILVQNRIVTPVLGGSARIDPPLILRLMRRFPVLRRIPARLIGLGVRPEHIETPNAFAKGD
ncbi:MAG: FAD-dependent oxidoreductase [Rhodospirillales bacterium]